MSEDDFESLPPPIYTLMAENGETTPPADYVPPSSRPTLAPPPLSPVRPRPASVPSPTSLRSLPPTPPATSTATAPIRYVYYQIFGADATLPSRNSFDPADETIGRVPARTFPPSRTARVIKQYIARSEGLDPSQIADIYMDAESDGDPIPDGAKIGIMTDGGPGTTRELPLAIILVDDAQLPEESPAPRTPVSPPLPPVPSPYFDEISPRLLTTPLPPVTPITPPYSQIALPPSNTSVLSGSSGSSSMYRRDSITSSIHHHRESSRWVTDDDGFGEPIMSPTEADKVKSSRQPPGWLAGRIQTIGKTVFMGKGKNMNITRSGTVLQNGMRVWVDARAMKQLKLSTGDVYRTYRVIIQQTREITYLWTGDIGIEQDDGGGPSRH